MKRKIFSFFYQLVTPTNQPSNYIQYVSTPIFQLQTESSIYLYKFKWQTRMASKCIFGYEFKIQPESPKNNHISIIPLRIIFSFKLKIKLLYNALAVPNWNEPNETYALVKSLHTSKTPIFCTFFLMQFFYAVFAFNIYLPITNGWGR